MSDYLSAVEKEIDFVKEACADRVLDSVYIGGGTPTTLEPEELERLFLKLQNTLDWSQVREFTVEAGRADSITAEKLRVMKRYGVTRISVNPQTMKQETLDLIAGGILWRRRLRHFGWRGRKALIISIWI